MSIPILVRRSYGGEFVEAIAVGRMGKQLLIEYKTERGQTRRRWFKSRDYVVGEEVLVAVLPRWRRLGCQGLTFPTPILIGSASEPRICPRCRTPIGEAEDEARPIIKRRSAHSDEEWSSIEARIFSGEGTYTQKLQRLERLRNQQRLYLMGLHSHCRYEPVDSEPNMNYLEGVDAAEEEG